MVALGKLTELIQMNIQSDYVNNRQDKDQNTINLCKADDLPCCLFDLETCLNKLPRCCLHRCNHERFDGRFRSVNVGVEGRLVNEHRRRLI